MKKLLTLLVVGLVLASCGSHKKSITANDLAYANPINVQIDITNVNEDKVPVTVNPGRFDNSIAIFRLPKVIPGTYMVSNFGKYIEGFRAFDYNGNEMPVTKLDSNSWSIANATKLDKVSYWVNDTFDQEVIGGIGQDEPFSPAGTNIEPDDYLLNLHGFVGYFDSLQNTQYTINVTAPAIFERSSALPETSIKSGPMGKTITTTYRASRYFDVTDNPMMFGKLSKEEFQVGDISVGLSVYSPNNLHSASSIKATIYKMMQAQKQYLGDLNTTPKYDIFLYLSTQGEDAPKGFGALEHHKSTVVVFPENSPADALATSITDVISHEFFHIVSPLSIHSEDIQYFNFNTPTFSKHLWMYEGVTEYFANHFQVYEGLIESDEFYSRMIGKIKMSRMMDDTMSFTTMSENVLDEPYSNNYLNVYQKGALIGMCIDILMREESNGKRSMLSLMKDLSVKYGVNKPFNDDTLIDEITKMTYPSVGEFFQKHVVGTTPIDYDAFFKKVGLTYVETKVKTNYIMNDGEFIFLPDMATQSIAFGPLVADNSFWNEQGVQPGDIVKEVNTKTLTFENAQQVFTEMFLWQPGTEIDIKLSRAGEDIIIKTKTTQSYAAGKKLVPDDTATHAQIDLRNAWLKG